MRSNFRLTMLLAGASALAACAPPARVQSAAVADLTAAIDLPPPAPVQAEPAPVSALVSQVSIPHSTFQLENGLTVLVHEDHKAPVVAVSTWYNVGSKDEPKGKTGFAHLFEHLMFNGSENLPGDFFEYLQEIGATDYNGTTWFDRTNYFQTVPKGALERALFMAGRHKADIDNQLRHGVPRLYVGDNTYSAPRGIGSLAAEHQDLIFAAVSINGVAGSRPSS